MKFVKTEPKGNFRTPKAVKSINLADGSTKIDVYIPKNFSLFRYRSFDQNGYNLKALDKNEIWASAPSQFNDPYDIDFVVDLNSLADELSNTISKETFQWLQDKFKKANRDSISDKKVIISAIRELFSMLRKFAKDNVIVASFSETVNSEIMWGHYANSSTGFAIEYDYDDLTKIVNDNNMNFREKYQELSNEVERNLFLTMQPMNEKNTICEIFPVIYSANKYDITENLKEYILQIDKRLKNNKYDIALSKMYHNEKIRIAFQRALFGFLNTERTQRTVEHTVLTKKNNKWAYEKEWRIIYKDKEYINNLDETSHHNWIGKISPKAVYMGEFIKEKNEKQLITICNKHNIKLYKMYSDNFNKKRDLLTYFEYNQV